MTDSEKSIYGRKVFFLNPTVTFEEEVIERLRVMEYEVYAISDHRVAKNILRLNPDSICFVMPNSGLSQVGWHNFLKSFENEPKFSTLDVGVIMHKLPEDRINSFLSGLQYDAGCFFLEDDSEELFHKITASLDKLGAKGLRKYVRADCINDRSAEIYWLKANKMIKLKMIDISAVGIAATVSANQQNEVFVNQLISGAYINMGKMQVTASLKVTAIKTARNALLVVLMYGSDIEPSALTTIRSYVADMLKHKLQDSIANLPLDIVDYNTLELK